MILEKIMEAVKNIFSKPDTVKLPPPVISTVPIQTQSQPPKPEPIPIYNFDKVSSLDKLTEWKFVNILLPIAFDLQNRFNIDPWVAIAQASHESRHGTSDLARVGLNLYGIKATRGWAESGNKMISMATQEVIDNKTLNIDAAFRAYESWNESMLDWATLMMIKIYAKAYTCMKEHDGPGAIREIAAAGYATDPDYAVLVTETYNRIKTVA